MAVLAPDVLVILAAAKVRRLRLCMTVLAALAVMLVASASLPWYRFEYVSEWFSGASLEVKPGINVWLGTMVEASRTASPVQGGIQNPQVAEVMRLPIVLLAPLAGAAVSMFGLWVRSAALTALGLLGHLFGWVHLSRLQWWFEQAPGRENWEVSRSLGHGLFWFAMSAAVLVTVVGAIQALVVYRADRMIRLAKGEAVEESATELFVRIISRATAQKTGSASLK
jgi:hypothetical protein